MDDDYMNKVVERVAWGLAVAFTLIIILALVGCSSSVARVAASENAYDFVIDRFNVACHIPAPPPFCTPRVKALNQWEHDLHLAAKALKNGGKFTDVLKAIKADEKEAKK